MSTQPESPPCPRCHSTANMTFIGELDTEWGGTLLIYGCRRCGVVALALFGVRPPGY